MSNHVLEILHKALGIGPSKSATCESSRVVLSSARFFDWSYAMDLDLIEGQIDCSTLTSQSYWEGAGLLIPFVAESQRTAWVGSQVDPSSELRPSDIVFKYKDIHDTPDQSHNHVGLIIGRIQGDIWLIESASLSGGVRLSRLEDFAPEGGARRFVENERHEITDGHSRWLRDVSRRIGKRSRLGAKARQGLQNLGHFISLRDSDLITAPEAGQLCVTERTGVFVDLELISLINGRVWTYRGVRYEGREQCFMEAGSLIAAGKYNDVVEISLGQKDPPRWSSDDPDRLSFSVRSGNMHFVNWIYGVVIGIFDPPIKTAYEL